ncbi:ribonuclease H [Senna tora]|uniref:Ribonuclease H n=1 Tax=Senna tora TaxID=362788 RepID=A0A835CED8_9FABA|nr:ribonuclease H [Senna tora]
MTSYTFHAITSPIRALNPLGFPNTTRIDRFTHLCNNTFDLYFLNSFESQSRFWFKMFLDMNSHTFHGITSPIRALNPLEFPNTKRSDRSPIRALSPLGFRNTARSDRIIESIMARFFWGAQEDKCKVHLLSWKSLCRPKYLGGSSLNIALLAKHLWRLVSQKTSYASSILAAKYADASIPALEMQELDNDGRPSNFSSTGVSCAGYGLRLAEVLDQAFLMVVRRGLQISQASTMTNTCNFVLSNQRWAHLLDFGYQNRKELQVVGRDIKILRSL